MTVYKNLRQIAERFEVFLFDAYGVFWEGSRFYAGSREFMAELTAAGKIVAVLSNSTQLNGDMILSYCKKGLLCGRDCAYMISSGDVLRQNLAAGRISFSGCPNPRKYYVSGQPHVKAFAGTQYEQTANLDEADFVYCGIPYLFGDEVKKYPQLTKEFLPVKKNESGEVTVWDTVTPEPFAEIVAQAARLRLPVLNANPDFYAKEGHPLLSDAESEFVVRNGQVAEMFRRAGCEVLEYGKPHRNIYEYAFGLLAKDGIIPEKSRVCMIGDTVRTDIKGAADFGIVPVLCVKTGVTAEEISKGKSVESLCAAEKIAVENIIQIESVGGE